MKIIVDINDYTEERLCIYKEKEYLVRDNGSIFRRTNTSRKGKYDNVWTFGRQNPSTGYMMIGSERVHRIVAIAFHGEPNDKELIVDHIDTNRANNRSENLRWVTKLENALNNPITRAKIILRCGSIEEFLKNPSILYMFPDEDKNFFWMRTVTKEEARISRKRLEEWAQKDKEILLSMSPSKEGIGEWIYKEKPLKSILELKTDMKLGNLKENNSLIARPNNNSFSIKKSSPMYENLKEDQKTDIQSSEEIVQHESVDDLIRDSLTENAKQFEWYIPTEFPLCPSNLSLEEYFNVVDFNKIFSKNSNKIGLVVDKEWLIENKLFYVLCKDEKAFNQWMVLAIAIQNNFYLHYNCGCWYYESIARKQVRKQMLGEEVEFDIEEDYFM